MGRKLKDMEPIEMMATFVGAWIKYGMMMMFILFSSVVHIFSKFDHGDKDE